MNLDFTKVCGKHSNVYEAYYKQIDPKQTGIIEAMTAAKFLKKSGLSDVVLSRIWDLSDPNGKGYLDKPGFYTALKLVALAQAGQVINMSNIYCDTVNPPKVGDIPKIVPSRVQPVHVSSGGVVNNDWSISVIDRLKYEQLFESLKPIGGMLPGNKVKGVLMDSKLPMETLGKIWDLADQDKDGNLDKHEFIVAMHLVYQTLQKRTVPNVLPPELRKQGGSGPLPPKPAPPAAGHQPMPRAPSGEGFGDSGFVANFPKDIAPPPVAPIPVAVPPPISRVPQPLISTDPLIPIGAPPSVTANADWVVTPADLKRYEVIFRDSDRDKDGLVSGLEVKNVFLQSGVPQQCLAHIWGICDTNSSGKLTLEQFALAMWMVERKQNGIEPPQVMTANMVPPSLRGIVSGVDLQHQAEPKATYSNPELEMISKEIEELAQERRALETEIAQKEADIRIKSGEVRSLQNELDTLSATLKQLETQRGEAQKRLDDLKTQNTQNEAEIKNLCTEIPQKRNQVNKIREQCLKQEETINEQEGELNAKRSELQKLKDEEASLQKEYDENNRELTKLTKLMQNTQLQISSVRSMVTELMETQRQMTDALLMCRAAIESQNGDLVSEYQLKIEPDFDDARKTLEKKVEEPKDDPFEDKSIAMKQESNGFATNGFSNDPFASSNIGITNVAPRGGFDDSFNTGFDSGFDAFGVGSTFGQPQSDPFGGDAFSGSKTNAITPDPGKDDFGSDPFASLHAPTGQGQVLSPNTQRSGPPARPESPSPALPPKKSKVPPPRPAPPRPLQGATRTPQPTMDAFGATGSSSGFTDFAVFDNKQPEQLDKYRSLLDTSNSLFDDLKATPSSTPSSSTLISSSIPTSIILTTNNQLLLQQAASVFSTTTLTTVATKTTNITTTTPTPISTPTPTPTTSSITNEIKQEQQQQQQQDFRALNKTPIVSGPTDFSDDPFKDYRYEDPFNIKDPFADDNDDELKPDPDKVFKDDLSSDDDDDDDTIINNNTTSSAVTGTGTKLSNDFHNQFDAFNISPSPVLSQKSTKSSSGISSSIPNLFTKSHNGTPISESNGGNFDNFADFDAFSVKSSSSNNQKSDKNSNDPFFDAFNDNFNINSNNKETNKSTSNLFDAFGDTKALGASVTTNQTTKDLNTFDAFDAFGATTNTTKSDEYNKNSFEDDFFKLQQQNASPKDNDFNLNFNNINNFTKTNSTTKTTTVTDDNFAKFDAFDIDFTADFKTNFNTTTNNLLESGESTLKKVQNQNTNTTSLHKKMVVDEIHGAKLAEKFGADYSKPESFDADLEEAIKRSMVEQ